MPIHDWTTVEAGIFHDFHHDWITFLKHALNDGVLPSDYFAMAEQYAGANIPDVIALQRRNSPRGSGGTALATAAPKVRFRDRADSTRLQKRGFKRIAIRHVSGDRVTSLIEIVSPGNKSGRDAIQDFIDKATRFVEHGVHLLVLDLFPPTTRDPQGLHPLIWSPIKKTAFKLPKDKPLTLASYKSGPIPEAFVEPVAVGDRLPKMPLFLTPDEYVNVPLEPSYLLAWNGVAKHMRDEIQAASKKGSR